MRGAGAQRVSRAVIAAAAPAPGPAPGPAPRSARGAGRPVVLTVARLARQKGLGTLLDAAASWQDLDPRPLLLVAGDGPLAAQLRDKATALGVDAEFLGQV